MPGQAPDLAAPATASRRGPLKPWSRRAIALCLATTALLITAAPAVAAVPGPLGVIGDALEAGADAVTGGVGGLAVESFGAILKALFAWPAKLINRELLAWLVAVPDYAIHPETTRSGDGGSNLAQLGATTSAMAFAALGAVGTVAAVRYWAAGLTGSGGFEALGRACRGRSVPRSSSWRGRGCSVTRRSWPMPRARACWAPGA